MGSRSARLCSPLAAAVLVLASAAGCGSDEDDRVAAAQQFADQAAPGTLTVVDTRPVAPTNTGTAVTFAVADDPDAVVAFEYHEGESTAAELTEAVALGRAQAEDLRALRAGFDSCDTPVLAVTGIDTVTHGALKAQVWVAEPLVADTVEPFEQTLRPCVDAWLQQRPATAAAVRSLSVNITDATELEELPEPDEELPTMVQLRDWRLIDALRAPQAQFNAFVAFGADGAPTGIGVRPVLPQDVQLSVDRAVADAVAQWLDDQGTDHTLGRPLVALGRLLPGSTELLRTYQVVCPPLPPRQRCTDFNATAVAATTVNLADGVVSDHTLITDARTGGFWRAPIEP